MHQNYLMHRPFLHHKQTVRRGLRRNSWPSLIQRAAKQSRRNSQTMRRSWRTDAAPWFPQTLVEAESSLCLCCPGEGTEPGREAETHTPEAPVSTFKPGVSRRPPDPPWSGRLLQFRAKEQNPEQLFSSSSSRNLHNNRRRFGIRAPRLTGPALRSAHSLLIRISAGNLRSSILERQAS